jgi:NAD(P)-dependent dehydrogenase (short-subunit alcohol dehydrogenase family)/aryl carrier-like protein
MRKTLLEVVQDLAFDTMTPPQNILQVPASELAHGLEMVRNGSVNPVVVVVGPSDGAGNKQQKVKVRDAGSTPEAKQKRLTPALCAHQALHREQDSIFRREGTHVIIGGTGGLGRSVCGYMIEHGARVVVLISRSGDDTKARKELEGLVRRVGARLIVAKCDGSDEVQVRKLVERCQRTLPRICGVVHAAMVLRVGSVTAFFAFIRRDWARTTDTGRQDVLLETMSYDDYQQVIRPKVGAAWTMHKVLVENHLALDYFVALSSAAGILGSRGQGAYAAANAFLDSLMLFRVFHCLPGTSLDLTAVTGAGYLAENAARQDEIVRNFGNETLSEREVLALVSAAVRGVCGAQSLTGLRLHLGRDGEWPYYANDPRFVHLKAASLAAAEREGIARKKAVSPGVAFRAARTDQEATEIAAQAVVEKLSEVLTISVDNLDVARNITSYGLDSLTAIELRNWIAKELRANLQILELLSSGTITDLAALVVQKARMD